MSNIAPAKPTSITGAILTCTKMGVAGTDVYIKVMRHSEMFNLPEVETSGDGDAAPSFESSNWMYLSGSLSGIMVAASVSTFLLANLIDSAKNPLAASLKLNMATQQILTISKCLITGCQIGYDRNGAVIPLSFRYRATDSHPTWGTT